MAGTDGTSTILLPAEVGVMLMRHLGQPAKACACLNRAIEDGDVRLLCDGSVVRPGFFATQLRIDLAADGRMEIKAIRSAFPQPMPSYEWRVESQDVEKLIASLQ